MRRSASTKFIPARPGLVCSVMFGLGLLTAIDGTAESDRKQFPIKLESDVQQVGEMPAHEITESSGLVVSRQHPGVLWTHNDGTDRRLFAINQRGKIQATFEVQSVLIWDWEDLAVASSNRLYVADIGNNLEIRPTLQVHEIEEPDPAEKEGVVRPLRSWSLRFPKKSFDAEGLVVWNGFGYLVEKSHKGKAALYRWPLDGEVNAVLQEVGKLQIKSPVTAADLSPDGRRLGLTADDGVYLIELEDGMESAVKSKPFRDGFTRGQIEGCAFCDDGLLVSSEKREIFLFTAKPFRRHNAD